MNRVSVVVIHGY